MNRAVRIICILSKYPHITDLLMNRHWFPVRRRIFFKVLVQNYLAYFLFHNARDMMSNNKLLISL